MAKSHLARKWKLFSYNNNTSSGVRLLIDMPGVQMGETFPVGSDLQDVQDPHKNLASILESGTVPCKIFSKSPAWSARKWI